MELLQTRSCWELLASARIVRSLRWLVESRWQVSRTISNCWQDLGILGQYLGLLGSFVNCWAALGTVGNCLLFGILGKCWGLLGRVGNFLEVWGIAVSWWVVLGI